MATTRWETYNPKTGATTVYGAGSTGPTGPSTTTYSGGNIISNGQTISPLDPNYNAYLAQNLLAAGEKLTSAQIPVGGYVPGGNRGALPTVSSVPEFKIPDVSKINTDTFKNESNIVFNPIMPEANLADEMVAGVTQGSKSLQDYYKQLSLPETDTEKQVGSLNSELIKMMKGLEDKGPEQLALEQQAGLPAMRQELANINGQIQIKAAEYAALQAANLNKPITMNSIIGNERAILNARAADMGLLLARGEAAVGNITAAQETVNRAIDLKYSVYEARINTYKAQLDSLQGILNKEENTMAAARSAMLNDQNAAIAEAKQKEKDIQNIALQAIQNGADGALVDKIGQAKTVQEAALIAGELGISADWEYVSTPALRDQLIKQGYEITQAGGRTYAKAPEPVKVSGGGGGNTITKEKENFGKAIKDAISMLQKGEPWGTAWTYVKNLFPDKSDAEIDKSLGTQWREEGAFEGWKQKQYKETEPRQFEMQAGVWAWLASEEAQGMNNAQKKQEIMANGFDPADFNIY